MATATQTLTLAEFRRSFTGCDKAYEYWFGEAVPKAIPTTLHGITQGVVCALLDDLGYFMSLEVELRIHPQWEPRPDLLGSTHPLEEPYPTSGADLFVVEILSPEDRWGKVHEKCGLYVALTDIHHVYLVDPDSRKAWVWLPEKQDTQRLPDRLYLPGGKELPLTAVWERVDRKLGKK
jgi:Uma2 family endonuclease